MRLSQKIRQAIINHARSVYPAECCGLIINEQYHPCDNIAPMGQFEIEPSQYLALSEMGEIQAIVHSHPDGEPIPSEVDRAQMSLHGVPWVICGFGKGTDGQEYAYVRTHQPKPYQAPLIGREYIHGLQDCYSLGRDYYARECGIFLKDYPRLDAWWEDANSPSLYVENFKKEGFVEVPLLHLQQHDAIICQVGRTYHPNHALIYLGDAELTSEKAPKAIGNLVLHHPHGRLSVREIFGENWRKRAVMALRHQSLMENV